MEITKVNFKKAAEIFRKWFEERKLKEFPENPIELDTFLKENQKWINDAGFLRRYIEKYQLSSSDIGF